MLSSSETCPSGSVFRGSLVLCRLDRPKCPVRENVHQDEWGRRFAWLQGEAGPDCCCSCGGYSANGGGRTCPQIPRCRTYPQKVSVCTHHVAGPADVPLRCCVMGGGTPIYDQVRGERLNADVPPSGTDPPRADYYGKHRLIHDTPVPAGVLGPPGPGDGFVPNHHRRAWTYPAGLPVPDGQLAAMAWGPRAALPPQTHTRQAPRHAASSPAASAIDRNPAAQGTTAGDRGVQPQAGDARHVKRIEPQLAASAGAQFSWFSASHGVCD